MPSQTEYSMLLQIYTTMLSILSHRKQHIYSKTPPTPLHPTHTPSHTRYLSLNKASLNECGLQNEARRELVPVPPLLAPQSGHAQWSFDLGVRLAIRANTNRRLYSAQRC